jgi:polyisoprenyl-phosphate glycosyltransferase
MTRSICVLLPVYNEEGNVRAISLALKEVFERLPEYSYSVLFVDDGSADNTLEEVKRLAQEETNVQYISFSRNFGKESALLAGLQHCNADAVITMDADLQHPPELISEMISYWKEGYEVVYAIRKERNIHAGTFNRIGSRLFYKTVNVLSDVKLEDGISDFRVLDRKVVAVIKDLKEDHPFFRGLIKWVGFKQKPVYYTPNERFAGESTYNIKSLTKLALHGIMSFSTKPLTLAIYLGFIFSLLSVLYIPYAFISIHYGWAISGWSSMIVTIAFFGGLQLMILGIVGLYLGKTFLQGKQRPQYIIRDTNTKQ